ncbi:MAG: chromate transporter [Kiritimatiellae bacterium]|nr:chromate transporter [Kiritimatiellia bacterium]
MGCLSIFFTFFRIGLLTVGGGLAMATVMRHELVLKRKWLDDHEFLDAFSLATLVPGVIAVNMAYLQGRRLHGKAGSAVAIIGTILPSFFVILLIALFALPWFRHPMVSAFLRGCAIAVAGQLAFAGYVFGRRRLRSWRNGLVCLAALGVALVPGIHPVWAVVAAGILGYFLCVAGGRAKRVEAEQGTA